MLVRNDSQYHYERHLREKSEIYEGILPQSGTDTLRKLIAAQGLREAHTSAQPAPLILNDYDDLRLNILREDGWQTLDFHDPAARKPFMQTLEPLFQLLRDVPHEPHSHLTEQAGRNNCLPAGPVELKSRSSQIEASAAQATKQFLMRFAVDHILAGDATGTCLIVYPDGRFHYEKKHQAPRRAVKSQTLEGTIDPAELQDLHKLLDSTQLKNARHDAIPSVTFYEATVTRLEIPRDGPQQRLIYAEYGGRLGAWGQNYGSDNDRVIRPIRDWVNHNVSKRKLTGGEAAGNDCRPPQVP